MNLRDHNDWDRINGLLSVRMEPESNNRFVMLNGSTGNFCLDYSGDEYNRDIALQRAWSSDTGFYLKVKDDGNVIAVNWWDGIEVPIRSTEITSNPKLFYQALTKSAAPLSGSVISFAKSAFLRLRNCILIKDNGQASLRVFMYLLAALEQNVETPEEVDTKRWKLQPFNKDWINKHDWESIYNAFKSGNYIKPNVGLILRHASNRLFQEAHREATIKEFQLSLWEGTSRRYDESISEGAFYTPTPLVRTIVQEAILALDNAKPLKDRNQLRILDPACGSAEFLREVLRQLRIKNYSGKLIICGWDKSPIACEVSAFVLNYESISEWNNKITIDIQEKDSLITSWTDKKFDLILMNPPFISFDKLGSSKKNVLEQLDGFTVRQPDAAALFWKKACEAIDNNGVTGFVLPFSFLGAETYSAMRKYIKEDLKMEFSLTGRLGSAGLFEKAMIIPAIQIGVKGSANSNTVLWTNHQQKATYEAFRDLRIYRQSLIPTPVDNENYSIYENELLTEVSVRNNWTSTSYESFKISEKLKSSSTVNSIFNISRGIDTGNNSVFLLRKEEWLSLPKSERNFFRPCITGDSIKEGQILDKWYLFYPYGDFEITSEVELSKKINTYYLSKLKPNKKSLQLRIGSHKWWELSRPRLDWQLEMKPKLVSTHFGKSGYFAFDRDGSYLISQGFAWLPKKNLSLEKQFGYLAILHAPIVDRLLEMVSVNVAGGQYNLSKRYVDNMPLPNLSSIDQDSISFLSRLGKEIQKGNSIDKNKLNQVVANLLGINLELLKE